MGPFVKPCTAADFFIDVGGVGIQKVYETRNKKIRSARFGKIISVEEKIRDERVDVWERSPDKLELKIVAGDTIVYPLYGSDYNILRGYIKEENRQ
jgi:hypothetical protein